MDAEDAALEAVSTTAAARRRANKSIEDKTAAVESEYRRLERCALLNAAGTFATATASSSLNLDVHVRCSKMTANINVSRKKHCSEASLRFQKTS